MAHTDTYQKPLRIGEVAQRFGVTVPTIRQWERDGKLTSFRTPGNQRRYVIEDVDRLLPQVQS